jgi:hypothetical protein
LTRRFNNPNDPGSLPILLKDENPAACVNSEHMNRLKAGATHCHHVQEAGADLVRLLVQHGPRRPQRADAIQGLRPRRD